MTALIIFAVIIILLLLYNVRVVYSIKVKNFNVSYDVALFTPFKKELFKEKKIDYKKVLQQKKQVIEVLIRILKVLKQYCRIKKMDTYVKVALDDPMENGITFGAVSGAFNIGAAIITDICKVKDANLKIESDFESGEGVIVESSGAIKIRNVILALILNINLIKKVIEIMNLIKREDIENG